MFSGPQVNCGKCPSFWIIKIFATTLGEVGGNAVSQTLGTALGDWMADSTGLGYNGSAMLIAAILAVIAGLYYSTKINRTFLFWAAFILTRPLGATLANSLDKPLAKGGLAINDITATAVFAVLMICCIANFIVNYQTKAKNI